MLDIRRLQMLLAVHEQGSLTAAARTLHLTPSAISQQIATLEHEIGKPLTHKIGRNSQLTPEGKILLEGARNILREIDATTTRLAQLSGEAQGTVKLAIFQSAAIAFLPQTLAYLAQHRPLIDLHVDHIDAETGLELTRSRNVDLVIAESYPHHSVPAHAELDQQLLTTDPLHLAVPAHSNILSLPQAARLPWVLEGTHNTSRTWAINQCRAAGFEPSIRFNVEDLTIHLRLVAESEAAAILPSLITSASNTTGIRLVELPGNPQRNIFTAARKDSKDQPGIIAVRNALAHAAYQITTNSQKKP